ncbi:MAG: hypothetical protein JJLCMIEE_02818 [Acidimicrobiales bacterium]|nr:MAG: carbonic anhydrase [Actinomycetota bacterium]MBV6509720.1 hypothetical protein [Acidimicrobiales bacterium]RIK02660.1 MAG: hypothetical protein DCC48_17905 [Acidobacteriota bacterium]
MEPAAGPANCRREPVCEPTLSQSINQGVTGKPTLVEELLAANSAYSCDFELVDLPARPARRLAIVTCMDARILPDQMLGLACGDAHVLRNAGGRVTDDTLRSLIVSTHLLGVRHIVVVHHTDCGMAATDQATLGEVVKRATGSVPDLDFATIEDPDAALAADVDKIRRCPFLPAGTSVSGHVYRVHDGSLICRLPPVSPAPEPVSSSSLSARSTDQERA